jgi:hypothetical protein
MKYIIAFLLASTTTLSTSNLFDSKEKDYIEFVSYEPQSEQHYNEGKFDIRTAVKLYSNGEIEIFERFYKRYEYYRLKEKSNLYNKLLVFIEQKEKLKDFLIKDNSGERVNFGGAYTYVRVRKNNKKDEICYISLFMSKSFNDEFSKIYDLTRDESQKVHLKFKSENLLANLEKKIMNLHHKINPPVAVPPPSGMD